MRGLPALIAGLLSIGGVGGPPAQLPGNAGCVSSSALDAGCTRGRVLAMPTAVAVSPDGRNVYAAGGVGTLSSIAVFSRAPFTGALTQKSGKAGCFVVDRLVAGCMPGRAVESPAALALSPDGRNLYVAARNSGAVAVFARDLTTGTLTQLRGVLACASSLNTGGRCASVSALGQPAGIAVSPDGRNVYVAGNGLVVFARSPFDGALTEFETVPGWGGAAVAVSGDGSSVYLVSGGGIHGAVTAFSRNPSTGKVTPLGCVAQAGEGGCDKGVALQQPASVQVSPDGRNVYVASTVSSGIAVFQRTATGALVQLAGGDACVTAGGAGGLCRKGLALVGASSAAISPDGFNVYVASFHARRGGVAVFVRDPLSGRLTQAGCLSSAVIAGCAPVRNVLAPAGIALSRDGRSLYTAALGTRDAGKPHGGGIGVFARRK